MGKLRVRQHVNPLRAEYQQPLGPVDWPAVYRDPSLPLVVDLGCGPGRFLLLLQRRAAAGAVGAGVPRGGRCNYLGVEIRKPVSRPLFGLLVGRATWQCCAVCANLAAARATAVLGAQPAASL
jgi:tRNA G46 methylase TrmB